MIRALVRFAAFLILVALVGGAVLYADYRTFLSTPLNLPEDATLEVVSGDSIAGISRDLEQQGWLRSALYLQALGRLSGQASRIQVGEYRLEAGTTPTTLLDKLTSGQVIQHSLTIVEGWTFQQMLAALRGHGRIEQTLTDLDAAAIMAELGHPGEHPEGRFFPDTYLFPAGFSDRQFLTRAYERMADFLAEAWMSRADDLPLDTPYEALILASIIERETGVAAERSRIAGVFIRRMQQGWRLQTDPTVIYGLGAAFDGNLRRRDLEADTPYNTYTRHGLPPTPIALPGGDAIRAALNPKDGDAMYFVARGDGSHVFSRTLAEHNRAVREYQLRRNN